MWPQRVLVPVSVSHPQMKQTRAGVQRLSCSKPSPGLCPKGTGMGRPLPQSVNCCPLAGRVPALWTQCPGDDLRLCGSWQDNGAECPGRPGLQGRQRVAEAQLPSMGALQAGDSRAGIGWAGRRGLGTEGARAPMGHEKRRGTSCSGCAEGLGALKRP